MRGVISTKLESDQARMGPALLLVAQLYRVEQQARPMTPEDRLDSRKDGRGPFWISYVTI